MNDTVKIINNNCFHDWALSQVVIKFETIQIIIRSDSGSYTINCKDYIGFSLIGHWDENIICDINVEQRGDLIEESLLTVKKLYGATPSLGGGTKNIDDKWFQVNIELMDGNILKIACGDVNLAEN